MSEHENHVVPLKIYFAVFLALMVGTFLTVFAADHDLGAYNNIVALGIAVTKATLVMLFFMHVKYSPRLIWIVVGGAFVWLAIMLVFTLSDYVFRHWFGGALPF